MRNLRALRHRGKIERGELIVDRDELYAKLPASTVEFLEISRRERLSGRRGPRMAFGPYRQMYDGAICLVNQTAITGTTEAGLFPASQYTSFSQNQLRAGQLWTLTCSGIMTTAASAQGNLTITPRYGTTTGGVALGASAATALVASGTNVPWRLTYDFDVRTVGLAGANSAMVGSGEFKTTTAAIAAATGNVVVFGSTGNVSVDLSISAGIFIGITLGSASDTMTAMSVRLESLN